jgi:hypothetical protein
MKDFLTKLINNLDDMAKHPTDGDYSVVMAIYQTLKELGYTVDEAREEIS